MKYNFDELIERRGTHAIKYEAMQELWGRTDLIPMWVADMDFRTPPFILNALRRRGLEALAEIRVRPPLRREGGIPAAAGDRGPSAPPA